MTDIVPAGENVLTTTEQGQLQQCETVIAEGLKTFYAVGEALVTIRAERLYRTTHTTFEGYCEERWGIGKSQSNRLMSASRVYKALETSPIGEDGILPSNEAQIRPLTSLHDSELQREAWEKTLEAYPDGQAPAREVAEIVRSLRETHRVTTERRTRPTFNMETSDRIDWAMWSWNPVTGCLHGCPYCYARTKATNRYFAQGFPNEFTPTFYPERLAAPANTRIPADRLHTPMAHNVFVCSMADLFGEWVQQEWIDQILTAVREAPTWNFIFLTKNPARLIGINWPVNAWVGTTVDTQARVDAAEEAFRQITATVKFVSCEPFLESITFSSLEMFNWVIIGGSTGQPTWNEVQPAWSWVTALIAQARQANCQVYCKPNLYPIWPKESPMPEINQLTESPAPKMSQSKDILEIVYDSIRRQPDGSGIVSFDWYRSVGRGGHNIGEPHTAERRFSLSRLQTEGCFTSKKLPPTAISKSELESLFTEYEITKWIDALKLQYEFMQQPTSPVVGNDIHFNNIKHHLSEHTVRDQGSVSEELIEMDTKIRELEARMADEGDEEDYDDEEEDDDDSESRAERREEERKLKRYKRLAASVAGKREALLTVTISTVLFFIYDVIFSESALACIDAYYAAHDPDKPVQADAV